MKPLSDLTEGEITAEALRLARRVAKLLPPKSTGLRRFALVVFDAGGSPFHVTNSDRMDLARALHELQVRLLGKKVELPDAGRFEITPDNSDDSDSFLWVQQDADLVQ